MFDRRRMLYATVGAAVLLAPVRSSRAAPKEYLHAAACQELGSGESGDIHRSDVRVTNTDTSGQVRTLLCPVPKRESSSDTGASLEVHANVNDSNGGAQQDVVMTLSRRDRWGSPLESVTKRSTNVGNQTLVASVAWNAASYYVLIVRLPANSATGSTQLYTYTVERRSSSGSGCPEGWRCCEPGPGSCNLCAPIGDPCP